jgi:hypothetical protein
MKPFEGVETAVSHLIGIQAQILQAGAVSLWNRTSGLTYAVGTWRYDRKGSGLVVTVFPFGRLRRGVRTAVRQQAKAVAQFFDLPLHDLQWTTST